MRPLRARFVLGPKSCTNEIVGAENAGAGCGWRFDREALVEVREPMRLENSPDRGEIWDRSKE
jgi:hypothetical protein